MSCRIKSSVQCLLAVFFLACWFGASMPVRAAETGVRGTVLWGPVNPGPTRIGQIDEAPFSASFIVLAAKSEVARFKSDRNGNFDVLLPTGNYKIIPDKKTPIPAAQSQAKSVIVPADGFVEATLRFETGMR